MKKVLVVDDSNFMRASMKKILTKHGYSVIGEAKNGKIALEKYKDLSPDIVTMDITMAEMDGLEALKEIKAYDKNAIVIMVSAMGQEPFVKEAIDLGARGFLVKPYNENTVISTLSQFN